MRQQDGGLAPFLRLYGLLLAGLALSGCSPSEHSSSASLAGEQGRGGAMLAYEHELQLLLPQAQIGPRLQATREACETARFGACNVLRIEQGAGRAEITLRIAPAGVEPLVTCGRGRGTGSTDHQCRRPGRCRGRHSSASRTAQGSAATSG